MTATLAWRLPSQAERTLAAGGRTLHVLGDSHTTLFDRLTGWRGLRRTRIVLHTVGGATATGLPNPNSKTQAGPIFRAALAEIPAAHDLLFCLGEVDCGFAIWYRAQKHGLAIDEQLTLAVENYARLIDDACTGRTGQVLLATAPLPTIVDGAGLGEVANLRREITATLEQRTALTTQFNRRLADLAATRHLPLVDISEPTRDPQTGLIANRYRHRDPADHHLSPKTMRPLLLQALRQLGYA